MWPIMSVSVWVWQLFQASRPVHPMILSEQRMLLSIKRKRPAGTGLFSAKKSSYATKEKKMDQKPHILIVDDERFNIKTLTELLREDYKIMAAKTGEQALKTVRGEILPDLILLDIMMPGIDGYEVCEKLKANERTRNIPVIFVTAVTEIEDAARGFQAGAVDFIEKPLNPVMVKARVDLHIKLHKTMKDLKEALSQVRKLSGLLPICTHCKKIRDDDGYWNQIEVYIENQSEAQFSHGICKECAEKYYPDLDLYDDES
jgi:response regulator RpfG family c-di-GMP phosphodiesterase